MSKYFRSKRYNLYLPDITGLGTMTSKLQQTPISCWNKQYRWITFAVSSITEEIASALLFWFNPPSASLLSPACRMSRAQELPKTHRALVLRSTNEPPEVEIIPTPQPTPGSIIVRVLVASVVPYMRDVYNGTRQYPFPMPLVIGSSAIGRIAAVGPDTTFLSPGQLVHVDMFVRGRDDPTARFLLGIHEGFTEGSRKLMHGEWRDTTYAEYAKMPLENCDALDETRLLGSPKDGGLGYKIEDLQYISALLVPYGGLRDIDVKAG